MYCYDPTWADWVYPYAGCIDTDLPKPPHITHIMLGSKASWVEPEVGPEDETFEEYPELGIEEWHQKHGLYIDKKD